MTSCGPGKRHHRAQGRGWKEFLRSRAGDAGKRADGARPHHHQHSAEMFYVLYGVVQVLSASEILRAEIGDVIVVRPSLPHSFSANARRSIRRAVRRDNGQTTRSFAPALLKTSIYSTAIAEACNRNKSPVGDDFPVAQTRSDGDVRPGKAVPSGYRGRRPDERISLQQFRWYNAERQISWQPRSKVEVSEADRATSQTILKGRVRRAKKAASIRMAVVRNKADLIPGVPPSRADRRVRQAAPAAALVTLQTTRRRRARRGKRAANIPTAGNSTFRVVRAGLAPSGPALF
jgi:mannose-6-phosphate isomerase-like protein (cupin superfamily)